MPSIVPRSPQPSGRRGTAVYPDSDKIRVRWAPGDDDFLHFRRADAVDYWDGET